MALGLVCSGAYTGLVGEDQEKMKRLVASSVTLILWICLICGLASWKTADAGRMARMVMCTSVPDPLYTDEFNSNDTCPADDADVVQVGFALSDFLTFLGAGSSISSQHSYDLSLNDLTSGTPVPVLAHSLFISTTFVNVSEYQDPMQQPPPPPMLVGCVPDNQMNCPDETPTGAHNVNFQGFNALPMSEFEIPGQDLMCPDPANCTVWVQFIDLHVDGDPTTPVTSSNALLDIASFAVDTSSSSTPEPATVTVVAAGLGLLGLRYRQRKG